MPRKIFKALAGLTVLAAARADAGAYDELGFPSPEGIEKLACSKMKDESFEKTVVQRGCEEASKKMPQVHFEDCVLKAKKGFTQVKDMCQKGFPSPAVIEKMLEDKACAVAKDPAKEKALVETTCDTLHEKFSSVPKEMCVLVMMREINILKEKCPTPAPEIKEGFPTPADIEKMLEDKACAVAKDPAKEKEFVDLACQKLHDKFKALPQSLCILVMTREVNELKKKCPTPAPELKEGFPTPADIEKMLEDKACAVAKDPAKERAFVVLECRHLHQEYPDFPIHVCVTTLTRGIDALKNRCPSAPVPSAFIMV